MNTNIKNKQNQATSIRRNKIKSKKKTSKQKKMQIPTWRRERETEEEEREGKGEQTIHMRSLNLTWRERAILKFDQIFEPTLVNKFEI